MRDFMSVTHRDRYWDIVKGLGIMTVVLGHSGLPNPMILFIINYFHLAIFFFVPGFLYSDKHSTDPLTYTGRKLKDIWWPTMKYVIVFILLHNVFLKLNIYSTVIDQPMIYAKQAYSGNEHLTKIFEAFLNSMYSVEMAGAMWFIFPLLVTMVTFCVIRYTSQLLLLTGIKKEIYSLIFAAVLGGIGAYLTLNSLKLAWRADIAFLVMPVVYVGFLAKLYWNKVPLKWYLAIISVVILYVSYRRGLEISYAAGIIGNSSLLYYFVTFAGIYLVLYAAKLINNVKYLSKMFAYLGEKSFHIMALHFLAFKVINYIDVKLNHKETYMIAQFPSSNWDWWYLYLVAGLVIPIVGVYTYGKLEERIKLFYMKFANTKL
ncbi:acyltransferase family protein [Lysinibacillus fusiformis]